jgi:Protein of unknown function (DUF2752)
MNISAGRFGPIRKIFPVPAWTRPDSYWDVVVLHLPMALLAGLGLFPPLWVSRHSLPFMKCTFLYLTGFPCPFCGFTRSLWSISAGDWSFAAGNYPLSPGIYGLMALFFVWHATALLLGIRMESGLYRLFKSGVAWWVVGSLFFLNWVYRIGFGLT